MYVTCHFHLGVKKPYLFSLVLVALWVLPFRNHYISYLLLGIREEKISAGCFLMEPFFFRCYLLFFLRKISGPKEITLFSILLDYFF